MPRSMPDAYKKHSKIAVGSEVLEMALSETRQALSHVIQREAEAEATLNLSVEKIEREDTKEMQEIVASDMSDLVLAPAPNDVIIVAWVNPLDQYLPKPVAKSLSTQSEESV